MKNIIKALCVCFALSLSCAATAQLSKSLMHAALPETAQMKDCLQCHQSYEAVAKKTEKMTPNPHYSHRGMVECTTCHKVKQAPRFECNDCHVFEIKMKGE
jgi:nitrate reductase cytochrome c-type subunit